MVVLVLKTVQKAEAIVFARKVGPVPIVQLPCTVKWNHAGKTVLALKKQNNGHMNAFVRINLAHQIAVPQYFPLVTVNLVLRIRRVMRHQMALTISVTVKQDSLPETVQFPFPHLVTSQLFVRMDQHAYIWKMEHIFVCARTDSLE